MNFLKKTRSLKSVGMINYKQLKKRGFYTGERKTLKIQIDGISISAQPITAIKELYLYILLAIK